MDKIQVRIISQGHEDPGGMMLFLARLTQRGHKIEDMIDLQNLYLDSVQPWNRDEDRTALIKNIAALPHGTITRFAPITVAIVGASRRFLAQARTHQVGFNYVSASLQYSNYADRAKFVVPYALMEETAKGEKMYPYSGIKPGKWDPVSSYLSMCGTAMECYKDIADLTDNDTAGYIAPQGMRNVLVMQGNHEAWQTFIRRRSCNRNTVETQYVTCLIWNELLNSPFNGTELFANAGPDCLYGMCREGSMSCKNSLSNLKEENCVPKAIIKAKWPLIAKED